MEIDLNVDLEEPTVGWRIANNIRTSDWYRSRDIFVRIGVDWSIDHIMKLKQNGEDLTEEFVELVKFIEQNDGVVLQ